MAASSRSPFGHSLRSCPLSPARGDSFWVVLPPACPERGGGCEQSEQTEGLQRGCSCLRQPLSQFALRRIASSPAGESLGGIHKLLYNLGGPPMTAPTSHLINFCQKPRGRPPVPTTLQSPALTRRKADFTARKRAYSIPSSAVSIASSTFSSFAVSAAANCALSGWHRALRL